MINPGGLPPPPPSMVPPPGYPIGHAYSSARPPLRPIRPVARALMVLQIIAAAFTGVVLLLQIALVNRADDFVAGVIDDGRFRDAVGPFLAVSLLAGGVSIAMLVLLIIWSYRIADNLQRLRRDGLVWKPGLTIVVWLLGGCTLQIINFLMLREHWKGSDPASPPGDPSWRSRPVSGVVTVWFVLAVGQVALSAASGLRSIGGVGVDRGTSELAESLSDRLGLVVASGAIGLAAAITLIVVVRRMTDLHVLATGE